MLSLRRALPLTQGHAQELLDKFTTVARATGKDTQLPDYLVKISTLGGAIWRLSSRF